jgi:hypothetical protein
VNSIVSTLRRCDIHTAVSAVVEHRAHHQRTSRPPDGEHDDVGALARGDQQHLARFRPLEQTGVGTDFDERLAIEVEQEEAALRAR